MWLVVRGTTSMHKFLQTDVELAMFIAFDFFVLARERYKIQQQRKQKKSRDLFQENTQCSANKDVNVKNR